MAEPLRNREIPRAIDVIPNEARVRCVRAMLVLAALYAILRALGFHRLFPDDTEGIGAILQIVGTLYSVSGDSSPRSRVKSSSRRER